MADPKPTISQTFEVDGVDGEFATIVIDGAITSIGEIDQNGIYKPIDPSTNLFTTLSKEQTSLDTISINTTRETGNVTETVLQDDEQLTQSYEERLSVYNNKQNIDQDSALNPEVRAFFGDTSQYPSTASPDTLRYPYDIDIAQDHLTIKQYEYKRKLTTTPRGEKWNNTVNESGPGGSVAGSQYTLPFGKFTGGVILPMPKVSDSNGAEWGKSDLNVLGITAAGLAGGLMNATINPRNTLGQLRDNLLAGVTTKGDNELANQQNLIEGLLTQSGDITGEGENTNIAQEIGVAGMSIAASKLAGVAGIDISADELLARSTGSILNPNAELLFQGPVLRDFGFKFLMVARSEAEAKMIRRIIRFFKIGAAPIDLGGPALLRTPNVFKLEYKAGKKSLDTVNKFNEMALRTITVDYAPDGFWSAYQDSHPVAVVMSLQFSELRPVYQREHRNNTSEDSVGY